MNAEQVTNKILAEAQSKADGMLSDAKARSDADKAELETKLAAFREKSTELAVKAGQDKKDRLLAAARMELSKEYLKTKIGLLDDVFAKAAEKIRTLSDDEYRSFIVSLLVRSSETSDEEVVIGKNETRIDQKLIKDANSKFAGGKGSLVLSSDRADIDGG